MLAEEQEGKHLDLMMEVERVRALEAYQVRQGRCWDDRKLSCWLSWQLQQAYVSTSSLCQQGKM